MAISPEHLNAYLADQSGLVATVKRDYPNLSTGELTDQVIHRLNREHATDVFGRKARNPDGSNPNEDAVTIRLDDADYSKKKLIDVWGGSKKVPPDNTPVWQVRPESEEPGNGYWRPAMLPDRDNDPITPPPPPPDPDPGGTISMIALLDKLQRNLETLEKFAREECKKNAAAVQMAVTRVATLERRVDHLRVVGRTEERGWGVARHSHDAGGLILTSEPKKIEPVKSG